MCFFVLCSMNRGWFVERFTERISGHRLSNASGNSSSTTNNTEERPTLVMRSQSARTAREEAMSLEKYVESVLKDAEKCVLAIQVAKIQKATRKMKRSLFSPNQGGDSRILAICRSSREHLHFNLYKLYPAPSGKMSRQWLISDLGEVDGKGVNVGEFSLTFGDKIYAFRARSVSERNKFLWELMQSCKKSKGKAPVVRGIRLLVSHTPSIHPSFHTYTPLPSPNLYKLPPFSPASFKPPPVLLQPFP